MIAGGGQHSFNEPMEQHVYFKEVDIIGNPALPTAAHHTGFITHGGHTPSCLIFNPCSIVCYGEDFPL